MWVLDVQIAERALCNRFYFPLLASLLSDLDCISRGRQRQNKGTLVMVESVCALAPRWKWRRGVGVAGCAEDVVGGRFNKGTAKVAARLIAPDQCGPIYEIL